MNGVVRGSMLIDPSQPNPRTTLVQHEGMHNIDNSAPTSKVPLRSLWRARSGQLSVPSLRRGPNYLVCRRITSAFEWQLTTPARRPRLSMRRVTFRRITYNVLTRCM